MLRSRHIEVGAAEADDNPRRIIGVLDGSVGVGGAQAMAARASR